MDVQTALKEIERWPLEQQIDLVQKVCHRIVESNFALDSECELTGEQKAEFDRRLAAADANPDDVVNWESILEHVRRKR